MAEFVLDPVEKVGARLRIQYIGSDGRHTQLIRSRGERRRIAAGNCNISAFGNKPSSSRKANPAIPAGDQGTLAFQQHVPRLLPRSLLRSTSLSTQVAVD